MRQIAVLAKKEFKAYFDSPVAYVVITLFLLIAGWQFSTGMFLSNTPDLRGLFGIIRFILLFFIPAVSMRLLSEEKRLGTIVVTLVLTMIHFISITFLGEPDVGATIAGYIGLFFVVGVYLSIGIFTSALTQNQIVSFILSFVIIFFFFIVDKVIFLFPGFIANILEFLSIDYHFNNIARGVLDSRDVFYYLSLIFIFLFLTVQTLESRKWK